jgi:aminoglycoside phosphotransferase (APT) family kinase protein
MLAFRDTCKKFYLDKTMSRLEKLYNKIDDEDRTHNINKRHVPTLEFLFRKINWDYLAEGIPAKFHGDYNFSNIVCTPDKKFKFLDWRQDFGGSIEYGDIYYDFAKMYHSFLFPHPSITDNKFYIKEFNDKIKTFIEIPYEIERSKDVFETFISAMGYDFWKVRILTAIVLLNMSPLHEEPIDKYLYYFAKYFLFDTLDTQWSITVL